MTIAQFKVLKVDPEFRDLIDPLSEDEYRQLEENIISEGCRDALVIWNDTIVDGHNRYEICTRHHIPYYTKELAIKSRDDVIAWIIKNQLGRRNISLYTRASLALRLKPLIAEKAKENQRASGGAAPVPQNSAEPLETRQVLAKIAGVSRDTIDKVTKIESAASPEVKEKLRKGEISVHRAYQDIREAEKKSGSVQDLPKKVSSLETEFTYSGPVDVRSTAGRELMKRIHADVEEHTNDRPIEITQDEFSEMLGCDVQAMIERLQEVLTANKNLISKSVAKHIKSSLNQLCILKEELQHA